MATTGRSFNAGLFWVNENDYEGPGDATNWHKHEQPHTTVNAYGDARVLMKDSEDAPVEVVPCGPGDAPVHVPAGKLHRIECVKGPARTRCLFPHRDHTGQIIDHYVGYVAAYR